MARHSKRTAANDNLFFASLQNAHPLRAACEAARYSRATVYEWRRDDKDFAERWTMAKTMAGELREDEADRRGRDGYDEPVFARGQQIGVKRKYSDKLLLARLKAEWPEKYGLHSTHHDPQQQQPLTIVVNDVTSEACLLRLLEEGKISEQDDLPQRVLQRYREQKASLK